MNVFDPLNDRILVKRLDAEKQTPGGILLPDVSQKRPQIGIVQSVGPGKLLDNGKRSEMCVQRGNKIVYVNYAGSEIELNGEEYVVLDVNEVLGVIT